MSCFHPLYAVPDLRPDGRPYLTANGKTRYRIIGDDASRASLLNDDSMIQIPCGKCIGCRLDYSRRWADRLMLELQYHSDAWFVTLTYNNDQVPRSVYSVDEETGECYEAMTLSKRDIQLFMKRLRKAFDGISIRYYIAGEYGPSTLRPHYHGILFGLPLDEQKGDLVLSHVDSRGFAYYNSPLIERLWSVEVDEPDEGSIISPYIWKNETNGKWYEKLGFVTVTKVTWETCAYTARYVTKKLTGKEADFYTDFTMEPPFSLMSRKPGIARQYYDEHPDLFDSQKIHVSTDTGGRSMSVPKYFERLLMEDRPEFAQQRSDLRAAYAKASIRSKLQQSDLPLKQQLEVAEDIKLKRTKTLIRRDL